MAALLNDFTPTEGELPTGGTSGDTPPGGQMTLALRMVAMFWMGDDPARANLAADLAATIYSDNVPPLTRIVKNGHIILGVMEAPAPASIRVFPTEEDGQ